MVSISDWVVEHMTTSGVRYYAKPVDQAMIKAFERWRMINCNCAAYAMERSSLLPQLLTFIKDGSMGDRIDGAEAIKNKCIIRVCGEV